MTDIAALVADNLALWTGAIERRSGAGRGSGKRISLLGIDRLRGLILDLAVRGKLVPQNNEEEPAEVFLRRLSYSARRDKSALPKGWASAPLLALGAMTGGLTPSKGVSRYWGDGYPWVSPKDMGADRVDSSEDQITAAALNETSLQLIPPGSLLMVARSGILRRKFPVAVTTVETTINQDLKAFIPKEGVYVRYIQIMLRGFEPHIINNLVKRGMTVESLIYDSFIKENWPLPPLAEQHRIVAKVDELMALCDSLEEESATALDAHQRLVESLLATLVDSPDAPTLATNWSRLEPHFDTLFTTETSIDALKATILDLAVRGRLAPQHAGDEPAAKLMRRVEEIEQSERKKPSKISKGNQLGDNFRLPKGWEWGIFDDIIDQKFPIAYGVLVPGEDQDDGVPFVRIADLSLADPAPLPEKAISPHIDAQFPRTRLRGGEILMGVVGSVGKLGIAPASWAGANIARAVCRIVPSRLLCKDFIVVLLQSKFMQDNFRDDARTLAQPTLNIKLIRQAPTPIPPLAEQHRIVAKVDQLMALCDTLKAGLTEAADTQRHLADAIVEQAAA